MKKVFLLAFGLILSSVAFSQEAVPTNNVEKAKYIETSVDLDNPNDYKILNVQDGKSGEKFQVVTKKVKFNTPKEDIPEGAMTKKAFSTNDLVKTIEKNKDKFFVKEVFESKGTYYILFFPVK